jgi:hypothetical protein
MAITKSLNVKGSITSGTTVTTSQLFPMFDLPSFSASSGPWASDAVIHATASPLGYNGQDMHHRFMVLTQGTRVNTVGDPAVVTGTNDIIVFWASATDDKDGFVEVARYDGVANDDVILVSGDQIQAPYKFMVVEVRKGGDTDGTVTVTASKFSVESWGTSVR